MPRHANAGIVGENAVEPFGHFVRAVGDDHLARMQGVADSDAASVMERNPART